LTFRANASQDSLFKELQQLRGLIAEAVKAAHSKPERESEGKQEGEEKEQPRPIDPFAARQARNLEGLAKAARKFHYETSYAASTRSSMWGGSEFGVALTDEERNRIELWNDSLPIVPESESGSMVTEEGGSLLPTQIDASTTLTAPDKEGKKEFEHRGINSHRSVDHDEDDAKSLSSESDVELDFRRNLEDLAYDSFRQGNYRKTEECLRTAIAKTTSDPSAKRTLTSLQLRLALCLCALKKWDEASSLLFSLPKSKSLESLPIYDLLEAVALAHLKDSRFDDAYNICKAVLRAKRRIAGKESPSYCACLTIFAITCERKGAAIEGEAVRRSLPLAWPTLSPESSLVMFPLQILLKDRNLICQVFAKNAEVLLEGPVESQGSFSSRFLLAFERPPNEVQGTTIAKRLPNPRPFRSMLSLRSSDRLDSLEGVDTTHPEAEDADMFENITLVQLSGEANVPQDLTGQVRAEDSTDSNSSLASVRLEGSDDSSLPHRGQKRKMKVTQDADTRSGQEIGIESQDINHDGADQDLGSGPPALQTVHSHTTRTSGPEVGGTTVVVETRVSVELPAFEIRQPSGLFEPNTQWAKPKWMLPKIVGNIGGPRPGESSGPSHLLCTRPLPASTEHPSVAFMFCFGTTGTVAMTKCVEETVTLCKCPVGIHAGP